MIRYIKGDATLPQGEGDKILLHVCNNRNAWGKGFVTAINNRWPEQGVTKNSYLGVSLPEQVYRMQCSAGKGILGDVQFVPMETTDCSHLWIANMVAQDGFRSYNNPKPLSYVHLGRCLNQVREFIEGMKLLGINLTIHCPKIGAGLGGGEWELITNRLNVHLMQDITVYEI